MSYGRTPTVDNSRACQRVLLALRGGPMTPLQISERAHVGFATLTKGHYLRAMEAAGLIHVASWAPPAVSGSWAPVWQLGAGVSVPRPPRASNTETAKRWRHKRGNALAGQRRDIARMENTPPPTYDLPASIRNWLTEAAQ